MTNPVIPSAQEVAVVDSSTAYVAKRTAKASAGVLYGVIGYNSKVSAQFIQVHNKATDPVNTDVPVLTYTVPASSNFEILLPSPMAFPAGIAVCNSSTGPTTTLGSADCWFNVFYA